MTPLAEEALRIMWTSLLHGVEDPERPFVARLRVWPAEFPDPEVVRAGMLELLIADYAEFMRTAFGVERSVELVLDKLAKLEAIGLERDVFGHDTAADGWRDA